ncbi:response regulator transcription factor [Alteromonas sp. 5E99-2]|uniref:response regulator transcription factor n=1 Tax=Alteromonas sp. 5E99-2 TaxID=2817683 RepID=UPI001A9A1C35|nr:response regulator transcription factor [Alteromonas sp. 5E99-2]MBO1255158.1 response regulator transcription factor [Alteromonas sp. 5E99-2]
MTHSVLVVEDDPDIADLIRVNLSELGIQTTMQNDGRQGLNCAKENKFDLLLLDVMLPEISGLDICREIRSCKPEQAILMLTSKNSETDRVLGLELGADDYMTKPFSVRELQARVRSHLRRIDVYRESHQAVSQDDIIKVGELEINPTHHTISIKGEVLDLTSTEFDLIHHLAKHPNQVFSRAQLLEKVWGYHHSGYEHTVNSHINRLRAKVEADATSPKIIETVWGVGYKLNPSALS